MIGKRESMFAATLLRHTLRRLGLGLLSPKMRKAAVGAPARRQRLDQSLPLLMPGVGPGGPM